ncbi:group II intron reverse transcriptase/maturase [Membranihabitans maritimus]|uniref:group II intron reverse transcriptase/maturase n=1 Tax=Membranihabitans maritimus TaxID=2904244 RepID=UPI001F00D9AD|nr:group II intron reverse transcriptase/maturase [Membranihabitans maritimus]
MKAKPFEISRYLLWNAFKRVRSNKGSGGVDGVSLGEYSKDCQNNLYKLWNQMSSGSYIPPAVKLKEIKKKDGGIRPLCIPTVSDRIAQTVVKIYLESELESIYHEDSYGYRPKKSAADAIAQARRRCWKQDWVIDLDIKGFFDNIPHELLMKAVRKHCKVKWMLLYIERWLVAPLEKEDGTLVERKKGVPQGSVIGPILANLYLHYGMDMWLEKHYPECKFERYADDAIIHCSSERQAREVRARLEGRLQTCGLELHPLKTKIVYCKDSNRSGKSEHISFDFLGYTFKPRMAKNRIRGVWFTNFLPAVSKKAMKTMNEKMKGWKVLRTSSCTLTYLAQSIKPVIQGWINYYGKFYKTKLINFMHNLNVKIAKWARRKYKRLRISDEKAMNWLGNISRTSPKLFAHWAIGAKPSINGRVIRAV